MKDNKESTVFFARGTNKLTSVGMRGRGTQIMALGFFLPFDHGDADSSYGDASHFLDRTDAGYTQFEKADSNIMINPY